MRRGRDVAAEEDGRGEEAQRRVPRAGVIEVDQEVDGRGGLEVDVAGGQGVAEGGDADLGKAGRRQARDGADGTSDDLDGGRVEEPGPEGALRGGGRDREIRAEVHLRRGRLDEAAVAAGGGAGVQTPVGHERASFEVTEQDDASLLPGRERAGLDHPVVIDGRRGELVGRPGGEEDAAAVGPDGAAVVDLRRERAAFDGDPDQAAEIQGHAVGGDEGHLAPVGLQRAFVDDLCGQHRDDAALSVAHRHDPAMVRDDPRARAIKHIVSRQEIGVPHRQRGGDQAADLDLRAGAEDDPVGIDQEDAAVGRKRTLDRRGGVPDDAVEGDGGGGGLDEAHALAGRDVETGPVDHRAGAGLVDGQAVAGGADGGLTAPQVGTGRKGGGAQGEARREEHPHQGRTTNEGATGQSDAFHWSEVDAPPRECYLFKIINN